MSSLIVNLLERLAEMFPKQTYEARLENYIASKNPENAAEVNLLIERFEAVTQGR